MIKKESGPTLIKNIEILELAKMVVRISISAIQPVILLIPDVRAT